MARIIRQRSYHELSRLGTFEERFEYLRMNGQVGKETFGFDRILNQRFYGSQEWKDIRNYVIARDNGCDLGCEGYDIHSNILIHHMNPITEEQIIHRDEDILNPEFLITTCKRTHNAIHFSDEALLLANKVVERRPGDTCPWR